MALAKKRTKHVRTASGRVLRESTPTYLTAQQAVQRIDEMIRELEAIRRQLTQPASTATANLVDELRAVARQGAGDGYGIAHPAFGIWANRSDITDAAQFAEQLRERVETRSDGNNRK